MKPLMWKQVVVQGVFLLMILAILSLPVMASAEGGLVLKTLAMGTAGDKPAKAPEAPTVAEPTLMIRLGSAHFDPLYNQPVPASGLPVIQAFAEATTGYYVVQFDGPVQPAWKAALQQTGAEIFDYVPDFAFMVRMRSASQDAVRALAHVRWVGIYQPSYRISQNAMSMMYTQAGEETAPPVALRVNIFPGVDLADMQKRIQALGGNIKETSTTQLKATLKVEIPANNISALTGIDGVKWIEPVPQWKLFNDVSTDIMNVRSARNTFGLYGSGQTMGVADTGLDQGSTVPASLHDDFEDGAGASRVAALLDTAGDANTSDTNGHGTHVAGSVLGNGVMSGSDPATNDFPATSLAGTAPKAGLVFQALLENSTGFLITPADLNNLFNAAQTAGADLHTNSWGFAVYGQYTATSQDVDEYMWNHKDFLIQFAAGNEGVDMDADGVVDLYSLSAPATAKNCLTVGASEGDRPSGEGADGSWGTGWPNDYSTDPIASDHVSNNDRGMAAFSSRGPTLDGRHKPDIVAPGTNILSTRSFLASGDGWGAYDPNYLYMGGTSMATPLAAGAAALMREYLMKAEGFAPPSAALIKAALLNSAEDIGPGQYGTDTEQEIPDLPVPNNVEGWGRLNLGDGIYPVSPMDIFYYDESTGVNTSGYNDYTLSVTNAGAPLKVNLVWTDYPGTPAAQGGLVNDLDLQVVGPGSTRYADNASQKSTVNTLSYDADFPVDAVGGPNSFATRFTPVSYPAHVDSVSVYPFNGSPGSAISVVVYADAGGVPGTALFTKSVPYIPTNLVTIPVEGVEIASGDFFVGVEVSDTSTQGIARDNSDSGGRTFYFSGGTWTSIPGYSWYIRANVRSADYSTTYDRVNNTLGVTIATPAVGTYTIRVAGYNVPQGPQPYALVVSGNIQNLLAGALQFSAATYSQDEDGTTASISVTRTGDSDGAVSVQYATSNGTATAGSDYTAASGVLNWTDGDTATQTFNVAITDDSTGEDDETIHLTLSNATGGAALGATTTAVLTIEDNEPGAVQFSASGYSVSEGGGTAIITVTRTNGSCGSARVDYATSDGTATAGSDYPAASGTVTLADGDASGSFSVTITDDGDKETNETVTLTLSNPTGGATLGSPGTATLTINDNDGSSSGGGGGGGGGGGCFIDTASFTW